MKEAQNKMVNVDEKDRPSPIRFRQMYLQDNDVKTKTFPGCNSHEIKLMQERHALAEWIKSDEIIKMFLDALDESGNDLFNQTFLDIVVKKGGTKDVAVPGSRDDNVQMKDVL
jgi:trans-aconitate methyltransferase